MGQNRVHSSLELTPPSSSLYDSSLEGISASVMLLLKLIHDQKDEDGRKMQRIAGMISILDDVKSRIEKSQLCAKKKAVFRRCNTEIRRGQVVRERKPMEASQEENERLRRELAECLAARKSLERMFSSLGKEKEIMATELTQRAHELSELEEDLTHVKAQNERLSEKVKFCAANHIDLKDDDQLNVALQKRNQVLSDQLLKCLDEYRALKRRWLETQEENTAIHSKMAHIAHEVEVGVDRIHNLQQQIRRSNQPIDVEEELSAMQDMFRCLDSKLNAGGALRGDCSRPASEFPSGKRHVLA